MEGSSPSATEPPVGGATWVGAGVAESVGAAGVADESAGAAGAEVAGAGSLPVADVVAAAGSVPVDAVSSFFSTIVKRITAKAIAAIPSTAIWTIGFSFSAFLIGAHRRR